MRVCPGLHIEVPATSAHLREANRKFAAYTAVDSVNMLLQPKHAKQVASKADDSPQYRTCIMCMEEPRQATLAPCGHRALYAASSTFYKEQPSLLNTQCPSIEPAVFQPCGCCLVIGSTPTLDPAASVSWCKG